MPTIIVTANGKKKRVDVCRPCMFKIVKGEEYEVDLCDDCAEKLIQDKA